MADVLRAQRSPDVQRLMVTVALALVPALLVRALTYGANSLINVATCLITAAVIELTLDTICSFVKRPRLIDPSTWVTALLLAVALPAALPWTITIIATSTALLLGKEAYGGLGRNPFNPAMVGIAITLAIFPHAFTSAALITYSATHGQQLRLAWLPQDLLLATALLGGGLALRYLRIISWHAPMAMLVIVSGAAAVAHGLGIAMSQNNQLFPWFSSTVQLYAWFIVTDPVTGATTRKGQLLFGALVGMLLCTFFLFGTPTTAAPFAVLIANAAVPWIDRLTLALVAESELASQ